MWRRSRQRVKENELDEEILAHLAIEVKRRTEAGETPEEAERAARRHFGNIARVKEVTREKWGNAWIGPLAQDLKYGARTMRKAPGFTLVAILTLGLGIGSSTAVFSVVHGILFRPLPYPEPDRITMLWRLAPISNAFGVDDFPWGRADFSLLREQTKVFESLGAFQADTFNLTGQGEPVFLEGMRATAGFFPSLGVAPELGRVFTASEDSPGHERVVVLGDRLWRDRFSAARDILGQTVELNGLAYTVVGVMPRGFSFPHGEEMPAVLEFPREAQLWTPLAIAPGDRGPSELAVVGRLRRQVTLPQVQAEMNVFAHTLERLLVADKAWTRTRTVSLETQILGDTRRPLLLLLGAVGLVLLIASSNVAGLVVSRSLGRRREFHLRAALGAGYLRLVRQMLTEALLLSTVGGVCGIALAEIAVGLVKRLGPVTLPRLQEVTIDPVVFAFGVGVTLLSGLIFGFAPAVGAARKNPADSLKTRSNHGQHLSSRLRSGLLIGQIALTLVLVVAAALLARTFYGLLHVDGGFRDEHVLTFELSLPAAQYPDPDAMARLYQRALKALQSLPGVVTAGLVHAVPMGGAPDATVIRVPGLVPKPGERPYANYMFTSPEYFATVRTPLLRGREFLDSDTLTSAPVTVINRAMAEALWPGQEAIGKQVGVGSTRYPLRTVVGVVANVKQSSLRDNAAPQMYVPYTQNEIKTWPPMRTMQVAIRTVAEPARMTTSVQNAMHQVDPALPLARVATLTALVGRSLTQPRFAMLLLAGFGALALALASVGIYGVISYTVANRTQEIGVRMALGAERAEVFRMVLLDGTRLAAAGIAIGWVCALAAMRALSGFLYNVQPADPLTFGAVSALLAGVALLACYLPARRATRVDPLIALRSE